MAMKIVHLLKEIHVYHDEHQVAVIHLVNVCSPLTLVVTQNLTGLSREDFLHVAAVPNSGKYVGKGDLLQLEILSLEFQAMPSERVLLIFKFILETAHFFKVLAREAKQAQQFAIQQMLLEKHEPSHEEHHGCGQHNAIGPNPLWSVSGELRPHQHQRCEQDRQHGKARLPNSKTAHRGVARKGFIVSLSPKKTDANKPRHRRYQWDVIEAAGVVEVSINCFAGGE